MKKTTLVQIPINHCCISIIEYYTMQNEVRLQRDENRKLQSNLEEQKKLVVDLTRRIETFKTHVNKLEENLKSETDSAIYWFQKHQELKKKLENLANASSAGTEAAPNAKTEAD